MLLTLPSLLTPPRLKRRKTPLLLLRPPLLPLALPTRLIRLPESAIQNGQDFSYVWTIEKDSKAVLTKVTIAGRNDGYAYIASGLQPGAQVVTDALAKLKAGGKVKTRSGKPGGDKSGDAKPERPA